MDSKLKETEGRDPCPIIRKLVDLMDNKMSTNFVERHTKMLNEFLSCSEYGFWLRDLPYLIKLLQILSDKLKDTDVYLAQFKKLLELSCFRPMRIKFSEASTSKIHLEEYFSILGYLLLVHASSELQCLVIRALKSLLGKNKRNGICCVKMEDCQEAAARSRFPYIISQLLAMSHDEDYKKLLDLVEFLCKIELMCVPLVEFGAVSSIISRLSPNWQLDFENTERTANVYTTSENLDVALNILWRCLGVFRRSRATIEESLLVCPAETWEGFSCALRALVLVKSYSKRRNSILATLIIFSELFDLSNVTPQLLDDVALLCSFPEVANVETWVSEVFFQYDEDDYEFKKMLLLIVCRCAKIIGQTREEFWEVLEIRNVMSGTLTMIMPKSLNQWQMHQKCSILTTALKTLAIISENLIHKFVESNGPDRLVQLLQTNEVKQTPELLKECLNVIRSTLKTRNHNLRLLYRENNAMGIISRSLRNIVEFKALTRETQTCISYIFIVLQTLNEDRNWTDFCVIDTVLKYGRRFLNPRSHDTGHDFKTMVYALDFLGENVKCSRRNLKYFISNCGVYLLLDLIETCCLSIKLTALRIIVQLCEEGSCTCKLLEWKKGKKTLKNVLLDIFKQEDEGLCEQLLPMEGTAHILPTKQKVKKRLGDLRDRQIAMKMGNFRPKVYAILRLLEHKCKKITATEKYNEIFKVSIYNDEQVTYVLAKNFLVLKLGEAWMELKKDLELLEIELLPYDAKIISMFVERYHKWLSYIQTVQEEVVRNQLKQDSLQEQQFYNFLKEATLSEALSALRELNYMARCTETIFRLMAKMKQVDQVSKSLKSKKVPLKNLHRTFTNPSKVTTVFKQKLSIESDIITESNREQLDLKLVSPIESKTDLLKNKSFNVP